MKKIKHLAIAIMHWFNHPLRKIAVVMLSFLGTALMGWSLCAKAAPNINPELEAQVLQIISNHPEVIIESVQNYQQAQQQKVQQSRQEFLQSLQTNPRSIIGNSPTTGATDFKIVLVEFSDFQCPYCAAAHTTVKQFMEKYQNEVTLGYKNLPLASIHPEAVPAAKSAWAAYQQGKFWQYYDELFTQQAQLGEELYLQIAQKLNLNLEQFKRDRNRAMGAINQDLQIAANLGINGTPFFIMNGETFSGALQLSDLEEILARVKNS